MTKGVLILLTAASAALLAACSGLGAVAPSSPAGPVRSAPGSPDRIVPLDGPRCRVLPIRIRDGGGGGFVALACSPEHRALLARRFAAAGRRVCFPVALTLPRTPADGNAPDAAAAEWPELAESLGDGDWRIVSTTRREGVPPRFEIFRTGAGGASQVQLARP